jgi:Domain of unknown function (DUF4055)
MVTVDATAFGVSMSKVLDEYVASADETSPATKSAAWLEMAEHWELLDDLLGGTLRMRERGERWLPREEAEEQKVWDRRRRRSVLYGALKRSIRRLVEKPFSRKIQVSYKAAAASNGAGASGSGVPPWLSDLQKKADPSGRSLTQVVRAFFEDAVAHGLSHILVDAKQVPPKADGTPYTIDDVQSQALYPRLLHIPAGSLFAWNHDEAGNLIEIRWYEERVVREGQWKEVRVPTIWVLRPGYWERWKIVKPAGNASAGKMDLVPDGSGPSLFKDRIPLVTLYTAWKAPMCAEPPLEDLAWLNLAHWQSSSDQRSILHFARVPILFWSGRTDAEVTEPKPGEQMALGAGAQFSDGNEHAKLQFVEHTGQAIGAGRRDLLDLKEEMEQLGMAPLLTKMGFVTATAKIIDEGDNESQAQTWIQGAEAAVLEAIELVAIARKQPIKVESLQVDIFSDFGLAASRQTDAQVLLESAKMYLVPRAETLSELKRRGFYSETLDVEMACRVAAEEQKAELELIAETTPEPAATAVNGNGGSPKKPAKKRQPSPTRQTAPDDGGGDDAD